MSNVFMNHAWNSRAQDAGRRELPRAEAADLRGNIIRGGELPDGAFHRTRRKGRQVAERVVWRRTFASIGDVEAALIGMCPACCLTPRLELLVER